MSLYSQTVDVATLAKVAGGLVTAGGIAIGLVSAEVSEVKRTKASGEAIVALQAQMALEAKHRDDQHREVLAALDKLDRKLDAKADKP